MTTYVCAIELHTLETVSSDRGEGDVSGAGAGGAYPGPFALLGVVLALAASSLLGMAPGAASAESYEEAVEGTSGLAHFWPMGEASGSSFADAAGGANAEVSGGVTLGEPGGLGRGAVDVGGVRRVLGCGARERRSGWDAQADGRVLDEVARLRVR